jgi:tRNA threonylcarbamoyladenosine biosynthesis protein TsaE
MRIVDEQEMLDFARSFSQQLQIGDIIAIDGPLGAGKTVFCKGVIEGLGFLGDVSSPTYTIVHHYDVPDIHIPLVHVDLYRINRPDEVDELGLFDGDAIALIEWASQYPPLSGIANYRVTISPQDDGSRLIDIGHKD